MAALKLLRSFSFYSMHYLLLTWLDNQFRCSSQHVHPSAGYAQPDDAQIFARCAGAWRGQSNYRLHICVGSKKESTCHVSCKTFLFYL